MSLPKKSTKNFSPLTSVISMLNVIIESSSFLVVKAWRKNVALSVFCVVLKFNLVFKSCTPFTSRKLKISFEFLSLIRLLTV